MFQVLGLNWKSLRYKSLEEFVDAMYRSEADHLDSFLRFVEVNKLVGVLRAHKWAAFAKRYNGSQFARLSYDKRLARAYAKFNA